MDPSIKKDLQLRIVKFLDVILVAVPFTAVWFLYYAPQPTISLSNGSQALMILAFTVLYCMFGRIYESFLLSYARISEMVYSQCLSILMTDTFMFIILWALNNGFPNIFPAIGAMLLQTMLATGWCYYGHHWYFRHFKAKQCAIVYDVREGFEDIVSASGMDIKFDIRKTLRVQQCLVQLNTLDRISLRYPQFAKKRYSQILCGA